MLWLPVVSVDVVKVAVPPGIRLPVPIGVPLSLKVTVPIGVPVPVATLTVAVKVTGCPGVLGFGDDVRVVVVVPWLTFCVSETGPLPVKLLLSGIYVAVME
jgi:hypothetical protein